MKTRTDLCRNEFTTDDLAEASEFLDRTYGSRLLTVGVPAGSPFLAVRHTETGAFAVGDVALPAAVTFAVDPRDQVVISTVIQGTVQVERGPSVDRYQAGDVLIGSVHPIGATVRTHGLRTHNVVLPLSLLHAVAGTSAPLRFLSSHLASPAARAQWSDVTRYVDGLLGRPDAILSPLIVTSAARLLAAAVLTVFPNTALESAPRDGRGASSATVRRATAFIDERAGQDITVPGIAAAACVTVRSLQLAFRRELDTTPTAYLRTVRLARAHRELLDAGPGQETVTAVAYRWGFSSASRFSAFYRATYGVSPKQTLERG